jgi:hypothetical protein
MSPTTNFHGAASRFKEDKEKWIISTDRNRAIFVSTSAVVLFSA